MGELQATLDFSVELGKFHNVDLFQRGFYQIRAYFKPHPKFPMKCEVASSKPSNNDLVFAQFVQKEVACSKTFQILYKKEEIHVNDVFLFKIHTLVDSHRIEECLNEMPFHLILELYFSDTDIGPNDAQALQFASSRTLKIHFDYTKGVHHHIPVLFDYFHLSAVTTTVHGTLLAIHQPSISFPKAVKSGWFQKMSTTSSSRSTSANLEVVLFGSPTKQLNSSYRTSKYAVPADRIVQAAQMHKYMCAILLAAHQGLSRHYHDMVTCLPRTMRKELDKVDYNEKLEKICDNILSFTSLDDVVETVDRDLAKLSAEMCILWNHFIELIGENHYVTLNLMEEHHRIRVQRFSEAYFTVDYPREMGMAFHELNAQGHAYISQAVKSSLYFNLLPPMQIECVEIDGDVNSLPVIFEERYLKSVSYNEVSPVDLNQIVATVKEVKAQSKAKELELSDNPTKPKLPESTADPKKLQKTLSETKSKPKFGTKSFIKNIKPESFRRPSSSRSDTDQVVLLGYRQYGFDGRAMSEAEASSERETARLAFMRTSAESVSLPSLLISDLNARGQRSSPRLQGKQHSRKQLYHISNSDVDLVLKGKETNDGDEGATAQKAPVKTKAPQLSHLRQRSVDIGMLSVQKERLRVERDSWKDENIKKNSETQESTGSAEGATAPNVTKQDGGSEKENSERSGKESQKEAPVDIDTDSSVVKSEDVRVDVETVAMATESTSDAKETEVPNEDNARTSELDTDRSAVSLGSVANNANEAQCVENTDEAQCVEKVEDVKSIEKLDIVQSVEKADGAQPVENADNAQHVEKLEDSQSVEKIEGTLCAENAASSSKDCNSETGQEIHQEGNESQVESSVTQPDVAEKEPQKCDSSQSLKVQQGEEKNVRDDQVLESDLVDSNAVDSGSEKQENNVNEQDEVNRTDVGVRAEDESSKDEESKSTTASSDVLAEGLQSKSGDVSVPKTDEILDEEFVKREFIFEPDGLQTHMEDFKPNHNSVKGNGSVFVPSPLNYPPLSAYEEHDYSPMDDISFKQSSNLNSANSPVTPKAHCLPFPNFGVTQTAICSAPAITTQENKVDVATKQTDQADRRNSAKERLENIVDPKKRFELAKEDLKMRLKYPGDMLSDLPLKASIIPYFSVSMSDIENDDTDDLHLIICVHGLDGNMADLRLVRTYVELGLPGAKMEFLMSERNQMDTFANFEVMTDRLVGEILYYIDVYSLNPTRISFIGHSLGNIIIRSVLTRPEMQPWLDKLHTFLSLSGPHLGTMYNSSAIVNTGMWFMQKWKKSGSLLQLSLKDHSDPRETFIYKLSQKPGLEFFKNVVLVGSLQDRYVPYHSARIEMCKNAMKDTSVYGSIYGEMINNILKPLIKNEDINFVRYDVMHALQNTANSLIGRAAHIAVLDSEIFIEKFMTVCGLNYFK